MRNDTRAAPRVALKVDWYPIPLITGDIVTFNVFEKFILSDEAANDIDLSVWHCDGSVVPVELLHISYVVPSVILWVVSFTAFKASVLALASKHIDVNLFIALDDQCSEMSSCISHGRSTLPTLGEPIEIADRILCFGYVVFAFYFTWTSFLLSWVN